MWKTSSIKYVESKQLINCLLVIFLTNAAGFAQFADMRHTQEIWKEGSKDTLCLQVKYHAKERRSTNWQPKCYFTGLSDQRSITKPSHEYSLNILASNLRLTFFMLADWFVVLNEPFTSVLNPYLNHIAAPHTPTMEAKDFLEHFLSCIVHSHVPTFPLNQMVYCDNCKTRWGSNSHTAVTGRGLC